jgi:hypothetical protein
MFTVEIVSRLLLDICNNEWTVLIQKFLTSMKLLNGNLINC